MVWLGTRSLRLGRGFDHFDQLSAGELEVNSRWACRRTPSSRAYLLPGLTGYLPCRSDLSVKALMEASLTRFQASRVAILAWSQSSTETPRAVFQP